MTKILPQKFYSAIATCISILCVFLQINHIAKNFDKQNFDKLIVGFRGETLTDKGLQDELLAICQIRQCFSLSNF